MTKKLIRPALIWLVTFLGLAIFLFSHNALGALRVMHNSAVVDGTVVELLPADHRTVVARYEVSGKLYTTASSLPEDLGLPAFDLLRVGDKIRVEYNPSEPSYGILGSAKRLLIADAKDLVFLGIFLVFVAAFLEFNVRRFVKNRTRVVNLTDSTA